jgi:uncharacterized membrane protein
MSDSSQPTEGTGSGAGAGARHPAEGLVGRTREGVQRATLERMHDPARVLALSDGVFAIIATLLVLDLHVPSIGPGQSLSGALNDIRPSLTAFLISFIVAGMYWVAHRDLFGLIRRTDRGLVWLNILYLLPLCLLPFGASLLGRYDLEPVALRIYGAVLVAIAVMRVAIWLYATNRQSLLWGPIGQDQRRVGLALATLPGLVYLVAILVAGVAPGVSLAIYAAGPVLYFLSITLLRGSRKRDQEYGDFT